MPRAVTRPASAYGTLANLEERVVKQSVLLAVSQVRGDKGPSLGPAEAEIWKAIPPSAETPKGESEPDLDLVWIGSPVPSHLSSPGILKLWTWIEWFQNDQDLTCLEVTNKIIPGEDSNHWDDSTSQITLIPIVPNTMAIIKAVTYMQDTKNIKK